MPIRAAAQVCVGNLPEGITLLHRNLEWPCALPSRLLRASGLRYEQSGAASNESRIDKLRIGGEPFGPARTFAEMLAGNFPERVAGADGDYGAGIDSCGWAGSGESGRDGGRDFGFRHDRYWTEVDGLVGRRRRNGWRLDRRYGGDWAHAGGRGRRRNRSARLRRRQRNTQGASEGITFCRRDDDHRWSSGFKRRRRGGAQRCTKWRGSGERWPRQIHGEAGTRRNFQRLLGLAHGFFAAEAARDITERFGGRGVGVCGVQVLRPVGRGRNGRGQIFLARFDASSLFGRKDLGALQVVIGVDVIAGLRLRGFARFFLARRFADILHLLLSANAERTEKRQRQGRRAEAQASPW